jgi:glycine C-acetyltransferase
MKDLFQKCYEPGGYFPLLREARDRYFVLPKLDGRPGPHMAFAGKPVIQWTLNNYLGLAARPELTEAAADAARRWGISAPMGSRFLTGNTELHERLERRLAAFCGTESSVLFNYGYLGVLGTVQALVDRADVVVVDALAHASMMDAAAGVRGWIPFRHNDLDSLENALQRARRRHAGGVLVMVEGVYGMTGDLADLPGIIEVTRRHGARLFVDDAHGCGAIGPGGRGVAHHFGVQKDVDIYFSTFAKSFAAIGGFAAVTDPVAEYLRYNVRTQIFAKSLPLVIVEVLLKTLDIIESEPALLDRLWRNTRALQDGLRNAGFSLGNTQSAVTPIYLGSDDPRFAMKVVRRMRDEGIFISAVTHPVVPKGVVLCRLIPTAAHTEEDIARTIQAFVDMREVFNPVPVAAAALAE